MSGSPSIAIVGGGLGGLTAALALQSRGLDVHVFEQAEVLREIGAGVSIHPNAARLLMRIGLEEQLRKIGVPIGGVVLRSSQGDPVITPTGPATPTFSRGDQGYNVHRSDFLTLLFDALPRGAVALGHRCVQLEDQADRIRLFFANGATAEADVVIGADGIRSVIQRAIGLQSQPRSEGTMAYRGLVPVERLPWASELQRPFALAWLRSKLSFVSSGAREIDQYGGIRSLRFRQRGILVSAGKISMPWRPNMRAGINVSKTSSVRWMRPSAGASMIALHCRIGPRAA